MDTRKGYFYNNVNSNCKVMVKIIVKLKCFFSHMQKFNHTIMDERNQIGIWKEEKCLLQQTSILCKGLLQKKVPMPDD